MKFSEVALRFVPVLGAFLWFACSEDGNELEDSDFDRSEMLEELADNLIIPNFLSLQASLGELNASVSALIENTTEQNLLLAQEAWKQAAIDFQHCSAFGFGPASLPLGEFAAVIGVFPVDEEAVEQNILDTDFNLPASFSTNIRGLFTIEYLIFDLEEDNNQVLESLDQNRKNYLTLIVNEVDFTVDNIINEWQADYRESFIANNGTAAGSSVSLLYNSFVKDYENIKNFKIELPAGLTAGQTATLPESVEAYYSGISLDLIKEHFQNTKNIWRGAGRTGSDIIGFEEYLTTVVGGQELVETTKVAINDIDVAILDIPEGRLSDNIETSEVQVLRNELQENTPNFKSSMSSLLGISITFNSGDGD